MKACKHCGGDNHASFRCFQAPKGTPKKLGFSARIWGRTRTLWFKRNQPNEDGGYSCYYCGKFLFKADVQLDHYLSRSRRPDLRFELSNLVPSCNRCNTEKGSRSGDEYRAYLQSLPQEN